MDFAPIGAKWYYTIFESPWEDQITEGFVVFSVIHDTLINQTVCKTLTQIYTDPRGDKLDWGDVILCQDSNRVYHYSNNEFNLLYDFAADPGDTLYQNNDVVILVDSISSINIDSTTFRAIYSEKVPGFYFENPIIVGIGDIGGFLFPQEYGLIDENVPMGLRCYEDSNTGFIKLIQQNNCGYLISNINLINANPFNVSIYPNPVYSQLTIKLPKNLDYSYQFIIRDISARRKITGFSSSSLLDIDISSLTSGIYFLEVRPLQDNSNSLNNKFIKL